MTESISFNKSEFKAGDRFGLLTVLEKKENENVITQRSSYYLCECDCGNETMVLNRNLTNGAVISCGCMTGEIKKPLREIPEELKDKEWRRSNDGQFLISENGLVYRIKGSLLFEASINFVARNKKYAMVSGSATDENGKRKQKHYLVHRLVGQAFIENPENKPQINHIDGNSRNNHFSNLEWVTASENVQHAYDNGLTESLSNTSRRCGLCGSPSMAKGACTDCKQIMLVTKNRLKTKRDVKESVRCIDLSVLTSKQQEIMALRKKGYGFEEIGKMTNTSRQNVEQIINCSIEKFKKNKNICEKMGIKSIRNVAKSEIKRINYLRKKLIELEKELKELIA